MSQSARTRTRALIGAAAVRSTLVVALSGLVLVACGGETGEVTSSEDNATAEKNAPPRTSTPTPPEEPVEDEPKPPPPDGEVSPPGTKVALGEPVVLPISSGTSKEGTASVTVRVEKGKAADLAPLNLGDRVKGLVPYYALITFQKVDGKELAFGEYSSGFEGLLPDGSSSGLLSAPGWEKCGIDSAPESFDTGKPYETCRPFLAPEESEIASVAYEGDYESEYNDDPVIWQ